MVLNVDFQRAFDLLMTATGVLVTAGAGMGVDSGLPDFRGNQGFWKAYPALAEAGLEFERIASPRSFVDDPRKAWGFYGHRLNLYRRTTPHAGFGILEAFGRSRPDGYFVFTSNVDGHFQKAGFDLNRLCEVHGSLLRLQCFRPCCNEVWSAEDFQPEVDEARCELLSPLPRCPNCGDIARPNVLMFEDRAYVADRSDIESSRLDLWRKSVSKLVILEFGAGTTVTTIRSVGDWWEYPLVRVNPREYRVHGLSSVGVASGALEFMTSYNEYLASSLS